MSEFGVKQKSIIGEELKNSVLDDYLNNITTKMKEWNDNLIRQETKTFTERPNAPDIYPIELTIEDLDADKNEVQLTIDLNVYVMPDFKIALTMLKEQADVAAESKYSRILVEVIESWSECYVKRIANFREVVEDEMDRYMSVFNNEGYLIKESKAKRLFREEAAGG